MTSIELLIYFAVVGPILFSQFYAARSFCPWVPTQKRDLQRILKFADLAKGQKFLDLGCGDGRVVRYMSQHSEAECFGIELSLPHYFYAKFASFFSKNGNVYYGNLLKKDLSQVDTLFIYGFPTTLCTKLQPKLKNELKPGAKLLSYHYRIMGLDVFQSDLGESKKDTPLYIYQF